MLDPTARPQLQLVPIVRLLADRGVDWVLPAGLRWLTDQLGTR